MPHRTTVLIAAVIVLALLAFGGAASAMALTYSGFMGNPGYGFGMMNGRSEYQGMMNGQHYPGGMMSGYQQNTEAQGTPVTGVTRMAIQNFLYQHANIQVHTGTTVTWKNQDNVPHSVTFKNGMKDSALLSQGQLFSYTFTTPGTYQYYCTVHPYMIATVTVVS